MAEYLDYEGLKLYDKQVRNFAKVEVKITETPTEGYALTYNVIQGSTELGKINIPEAVDHKVLSGELREVKDENEKISAVYIDLTLDNLEDKVVIDITSIFTNIDNIKEELVKINERITNNVMAIVGVVNPTEEVGVENQIYFKYTSVPNPNVDNPDYTVTSNDWLAKKEYVFGTKNNPSNVTSIIHRASNYTDYTLKGFNMIIANVKYASNALCCIAISTNSITPSWTTNSDTRSGTYTYNGFTWKVLLSQSASPDWSSGGYKFNTDMPYLDKSGIPYANRDIESLFKEVMLLADVQSKNSPKKTSKPYIRIDGIWAEGVGFEDIPSTVAEMSDAGDYAKVEDVKVLYDETSPAADLGKDGQVYYQYKTTTVEVPSGAKDSELGWYADYFKVAKKIQSSGASATQVEGCWIGNCGQLESGQERLLGLSSDANNLTGLLFGYNYNENGYAISLSTDENLSNCSFLQLNTDNSEIYTDEENKFEFDYKNLHWYAHSVKLPAKVSSSNSLMNNTLNIINKDKPFDENMAKDLLDYAKANSTSNKEVSTSYIKVNGVWYKADSPEVSNWALQQNKPEYEYSEIKDTPTIPTTVAELTDHDEYFKKDDLSDVIALYGTVNPTEEVGQNGQIYFKYKNIPVVIPDDCIDSDLGWYAKKSYLAKNIITTDTYSKVCGFFLIKHGGSAHLGVAEQDSLNSTGIFINYNNNVYIAISTDKKFTTNIISGSGTNMRDTLSNQEKFEIYYKGFYWYISKADATGYPYYGELTGKKNNSTYLVKPVNTDEWVYNATNREKIIKYILDKANVNSTTKGDKTSKPYIKIEDVWAEGVGPEDIPDIQSWALAENKPDYTYEEIKEKPTNLAYIWKGTRAEYEAAKDTINDNTVVIITDE